MINNLIPETLIPAPLFYYMIQVMQYLKGLLSFDNPLTVSSIILVDHFVI